MQTCKFCGCEHRLGFCPSGQDVDREFAPTKITITPQAVEHHQAEEPPGQATEKPKKKSLKPFDRTSYMRLYMRKRRKDARAASRSSRSFQSG